MGVPNSLSIRSILLVTLVHVLSLTVNIYDKSVRNIRQGCIVSTFEVYKSTPMKLCLS